MSNFNSYKWINNVVTKREQVPTKPHFQAIVFGKSREWCPPYDHHDDPAGTWTERDSIELYVFTDKTLLELFVGDATRAAVDFVFYAVGTPGSSRVKVEVEVDFHVP